MYALVDDATEQPLPDATTRAILGLPATTTMRLQVLRPDLTPDTTTYGPTVPGLGAGHVGRDLDKTLHGDVAFTLRTQLAWGSAVVRPYAVLRAPGQPAARAYLGAYCLAAPKVEPGKPYAVTGFDRLGLLDRFLPDTYAVPAGTDYLQAVRTAIADAGLSTASLLLDTTAAGRLLPRVKQWPLLPVDDTEQGGYTWLNVVNDLLDAVGYRALWTDNLGRFRSGPYAAPRTRASVYAFDVTKRGLRTALLGARRTLERDTWDLPNRWTFYQRNPPDGQAPLTYTYTDPDGVTRRGGLLYPAQPQALDAANQASLQAAGDARIDRDLLVAGTITHATSPWPVAEHADVYDLVDPGLGLVTRVQSNNWVQSWDDAGLLGDTAHGWTLIT